MLEHLCNRSFFPHSLTSSPTHIRGTSVRQSCCSCSMVPCILGSLINILRYHFHNPFLLEGSNCNIFKLCILSKVTNMCRVLRKNYVFSQKEFSVFHHISHASTFKISCDMWVRGWIAVHRLGKELTFTVPP